MGEAGEQESPIIHSILLNGKDSGVLRALPYEIINVSAVISYGDRANATLLQEGTIVIEPIDMEVHETLFWTEIQIPEHLDDVKEYSVVVRVENANGTDSLQAGRVVRTNHLLVDSVVSPGIISGPYDLTMTIRSWDDLPVTSGRASVTMVEYVSADNFTTRDLGEREIGNFSTVRFRGNLTVGNISAVKFDIDAVDHDRNFLGRSSTYALAVPFPVNITTEPAMETIRGHEIFGPFPPNEHMNINLTVPGELHNVTAEIYEAEQVEELIFGRADPIIRESLGSVNGSWEGTLGVPGANGSYILLARGERDGQESLGFLTFIVQEIRITIDVPRTLNRSETMLISIRTDALVPEGRMMISMGSPEGVSLLLEEPTRWNGEAFVKDYKIPLYAVNGSYYIMVSYQLGDQYHLVGVGYTLFEVIGGPTTPAPLAPPPPPPHDGDDGIPAFIYLLFFIIFIILILFAIFIYKSRHRRSLLNTDKIDRGISQDPEEKTQHGKNPNSHGKTLETEKEGGGGIEVELGQGEGEDAHGTSLKEEDDGVTESDPQKAAK